MLLADPAGRLSLAAWERAWRLAGAARADPDAHRRLLERYDDPHRHYHTRRHLAEVLAHWDRLRHRAERPGEAELALWYHDAVHDPRRSDNEALSAALAGEAVLAAGLGPGVAGRVETLILATRHDAPPPPGDAQLVVDADLAILGEEAARFDEYERQVREEYAWVPGFIYRRKRAEVLRRFEGRATIFATPELRAWGESRARENLARSLATLG